MTPPRRHPIALTDAELAALNHLLVWASADLRNVEVGGYTTVWTPAHVDAAWRAIRKIQAEHTHRGL